jgi:hypothetical protein
MAIGVVGEGLGGVVSRLALALGLVATISPVSHAQQATAPTRVVTSFDCSRIGTGQSVPALVCQTPELQIADLRQMQAYYTLRHAQPARQQELRNQFTSRIQALVRDCSTEQVRASGSQPTCVAQAFGNLRDSWIQQLQQTGNAAALEEARQPVEQFVDAQRVLRTRGFLPDSAVLDGVYGSGTRDAIARFQAERGIASSGFLTGATLAALGGSPGSRTSAAAAPASSSPVGAVARGASAERQSGQTAQLSAAERQNLFNSMQHAANQFRQAADAGVREFELLQMQRRSLPQDRFRDQARELESLLRGAAQEARQFLRDRPNSRTVPELVNAETLIQESAQRLEGRANMVRDLHTPPDVQAQIRRMEELRQSRRNEWDIYSRRPKTIIEQIMNYTCSGVEEGRENNYWTSGSSGQNQCIVSTSQDSLMSGSRQFDIRSFNERSFRLSIEPMRDSSHVVFGDERNRLTCIVIGDPPLLDRLQRAWRLAFRECPGVRSAF